jgi:RND family efflux transporter MFP subunit
MKPIVQILLNTVGPIVAVILMALGFKALVAGRELPERTAPPNNGMLVEVVVAEAAEESMTVTADGQVVPARRVIIQPQVSGMLTEVSDNLVPGAFVAEGDRLVRIYGRDYSLAVQQAEAGVQQAEAALEIEEGRQRVATREWELFSDGAASDSTGLAVREPQVRSARISVELAETQLSMARLNASRTRLDAPFDAVVISESAELGQLVGPTSQLASLVATDELWIEVAIPLGTLNSIQIPGVNAEVGSRATVVHRLGNQNIERDAQVVRLLSDLTTVGNMARLVVSVEDPFDLQRPLSERRMPLLLGSYVSVRLDGAELHDVVEVPRAAVHDGNHLYVAVDGKLQVRELLIEWRNDNAVFASGGIAPGERFVVSPVPVAVDGMNIRVAGDEDPQGEPDA